MDWLILAIAGIFSGVLSGLLGIGGGFIIVSLLVALGYTPIQAVATSSLVIVLSSSTGSFYNWRNGYLDLKRVMYIAIPAIIAAQLGVYLAVKIPDYLLLGIFSLFLITNIFLIQLRKKIVTQNKQSNSFLNPVISKITTGSIAGFLAGLLGVGGGAIMVPLQMLLLNEDIKVAIRTSLGVIVAATISSCIVHATQGNVLYFEGLILGIGGMIGSQLGTRVLPKLPDSLVSRIFVLFLASMAVLNLWQAWKSYQL
ncbi:sulfite exporter TauE/SafE family protein [Waterburya agarophytonicola K14]|uniref:Probable membrane transporter protein n=1 Tax=Waterburya agarophytonicola KI4 TaxID=2874699 RepID=A0A964BTN0_9CYAN|nr:sulfite exporter TauE/SafE family protein [Waterburya agarophytonicola]MCC0178298.1 sulfite exporter TauE/SafE family protein [Waterburya agarophytonicola KI4]